MGFNENAALALALQFLLPAPLIKPPVLKDVYWGPENEPINDQTIRPFKIDFDQQMVQDLKQRLNNRRSPQPALENQTWSYGVRSDSIRPIIDYWLNSYDFKAREDKLNQYPQFITKIQGLDIHYYHVRPQNSGDRKVQVLPLLMLHGWPSSVVDFQDVIPKLIQPRPESNFTFELIIPSLPGFGYSAATTRSGLGAIEMAHLLRNLMLRINITKFHVQGGDWGAWIAASMASMYPDNILGLHSTMCTRIVPVTYADQVSLSDTLSPSGLRSWFMPKKENLSIPDYLAFLFEESGYFHEQATKPDTIGMAFSDSPTGLAAYILEKFAIGANKENKHNNNGNLRETYNLDQLIDNLMLYWAPNKITSSMRIYAESINKHSLTPSFENIKVKVPTSCVQARHEIFDHPKDALRKRFVKMVRYSRLSRGGHFLAMEDPELFAKELWAGVQKMQKK